MIEYQSHTDDAFLEDCLSLTGVDTKRQVIKFAMQHYSNYT